MDLSQIEMDLKNPDFQYRLKAISALKEFSPEDSIPYLSMHFQDPEFLVRTFVARIFGLHRNSQSFAFLLQMMMFDNTPSVRAEAANSLSLFGIISSSHLVMAFLKDDHWLVNRSILAALSDMKCFEDLLEVCRVGISREDASVQEASVDALGLFAGTNYWQSALSMLIPLKIANSPYLRIRVAYALKNFQSNSAKESLAELRKDLDHRVVGAAMEDLLP